VVYIYMDRLRHVQLFRRFRRRRPQPAPLHPVTGQGS